MARPSHSHHRLIPLLAAAATALMACGGTTPAEPATSPVITIEGIEDGGVYHEPVTITFSTDRGSVAGRLNGQTFFSGTTVSAPAAYELEVVAHADGLEAVEQWTFEILFTGDRVLILRMLDLGPHVPWGGGGDALLLTDSSAAGMRHALVDAGPGGFEPGVIDYDHVADRLAELGVDTLQFLQLTHAHADHYAGMRSILERIPVRWFVYNGQVRTLAGYQDVLAVAQQRADSVLVLTAEWEHTLGRGEAPVRSVHLPGLPDYLQLDTNDGRLLNEGSVGTLVALGDIRVFLTGDGEDQANQRWRTEFPDHSADIDILKVGHHGANNAVFDDRAGHDPTSSWLEHTRPGIQLVTANGISHPRQRALNRLLAGATAETYCTPVHGTVEVRVAGDGRISVATERNADQDCVPGSDADT